ncbi:Lacal_2735 family protein [Aquimarina pacifica]|uniref:Lacal_2735 family protein n=1 Tax=Aquimarina pacifica TaxID=1296415 RepID=UPI0004BA6913|nr:Lacal_2735 family protein [Aquimarina pacifica]
MLGLFKKKSRTEVLQKKYEKLMSQWHELSTVNRSESDAKYAEAQKVLEEIDALSNT